MYMNIVISLDHVITTFNSPPQIAPKPTPQKGISPNNYCILITFFICLSVDIGRCMSTVIRAPKPSTRKGTQ